MFVCSYKLNRFDTVVKLIDCQNYQFELEKKVEDCNNPERIRILEKNEETADDIMKKLEKVSTSHLPFYPSFV